jgi:hypothetical protein
MHLTLPAILADAARRRRNLIVRPRGSGPALIPLDDLDAAAMGRVRPASFLVLNTSPGSYQGLANRRSSTATPRPRSSGTRPGGAVKRTGY